MPDPQTLLMVIDGQRHGQARGEDGLAGRSLADAGLQHATDQGLVDFAAGDQCRVSAQAGAPGGGRRELRRGRTQSRPLESTDGRAAGGDDDDGFAAVARLGANYAVQKDARQGTALVTRGARSGAAATQVGLVEVLEDAAPAGPSRARPRRRPRRYGEPAA